jgi:FKBP-type peptidyl-prolyl cis-trans isomerase SlyD
MNYTLKDDDGNVIDSSDGGQPLAYIQGLGHIIPGLESALEGKNKGDKLDVAITPDVGYGPRNDQLVQAVPKTEFQDADQIQIGMQFQVQADHGPMILTVIAIEDEAFILDGNHPLAGVNLNFNVEVVDVRDATKEELDHGHVHGPGGHEH